MPPKVPSKKFSKSDAADKLKIVKCSVCEKQCLEKADCRKKDEISIYCDECGEWYHKGCINISEEEWEVLNGNNDSILYRCEKCVNNKSKMSKDMKDLKQEVSGMKEEMSNLTRILMENNATLIKQLEASMLPKVERLIEDKIDIKLQEFKVSNDRAIEEKMEEKLKQDCRDRNEKALIEEQIKIEVQQSIQEHRELDERKNNIIIFNLTESKSANDEASSEEDLQSIKEIITHTNPELKETVLKELKSDDFARMGTLKEGQNKPRPIKLTLKNQKVKYQILDNAYKMKTCRTHEKIGFRQDLTKKQQEFQRNLKKELEMIKQNNEDVMIYKNQVIFRKDLDKFKQEFQAKKNKTRDTLVQKAAQESNDPGKPKTQ